MQSNEELWAETSQRLTDEVQQIIEFAKFVPGFINLLQDDQIMLLKGGMIIALPLLTVLCLVHLLAYLLAAWK